jgi:DNA polymerase-3 subunit beta
MIVPRKTIELLAKAWSRKEPASGAWIGDQLVPSFTGKGKVKGNGEITGDGDVTGVAFPIANGWITSRVIEGTFPDYRQVIPTTPTTRCTVPLDSFREILAQACAVAEPRTKGLQLTLCQENFQIHAKDFDQGETTLPVPGATVEGPDLVIGINGRYLMEMLAPLDRVVVTLNFTAPTAPMWLTDETYTAVVMPMRI